MRHALNLIDPARLSVPAQPPVAVLLAAMALAFAGLTLHQGWERVQLARALALSGSAETPSDDPATADADDAGQLQRLQRDEALARALAGVTDLPERSAARLRALTRALPDALWLTEVELKGRNGLRIAGGTLDGTALAPYVARLGQIDGWQGLPLQRMLVEPWSRDARDGNDADADAGAGAELRADATAWHRFELASGEMPAAPGLQP